MQPKQTASKNIAPAAPPPAITVTIGDETLIFTRRASFQDSGVARFVLIGFTITALFSCVALMAFAFISFNWILGILLIGVLWFSYETVASAWINKEIITVTPSQITSHMRPLPTLLHSYQLTRADIESLHVKRNKPAFWTAEYSLLARAPDGTETELFDAENAEEVLYVEYEIERMLGLTNPPIDESLSDLFTHRLTGFESWQALANRHQELTLVNRGTELQISGLYGDCTIYLTVAPEDEWSDTQQMTMRFTLVGSSSSPSLTDAQLLDLLALPEGLELTGLVEAEGEGLCYRPEELLVDLDELYTHLDFFAPLAGARPNFLAKGPHLIDLIQAPILNQPQHPFYTLINQWLTDIAAETVARWGGGKERLICTDCYTTIIRQTLPIKPPVDYYACRRHRHSSTALPVTGQVVAVLDEAMVESHILDTPHLRVNWLKLGHLFDFDVVEILRANDEQVERFAVQVGNDTDPTRKDNYAHMNCRIDPEAQLSDNSLRVLRRLFGGVETR